SLSWTALYEVTPPEHRPYVYSTQGNSMLELVVGHNLVQRFVRQGAPVSPPDTARPLGRDFAPAGPLRLFAPRLAAQIGWLLPLALIGAVAAWLSPRPHRHPLWERADLALWGGWALVYGAVFSAAGGL